MQRVSALLPSWDRSKTSNANTASTTAARRSTPLALDKVFGWAEKIAPGSRISISTAPNNSAFAPPARYGREEYWPTTLDRECNKAARILKSFCTDGFLAVDSPRPQSEPVVPATPDAEPTYVSKKIPPRVIQNAVGLAVFSCMRSGLWMSGSGGAGMITARKADGTWSPPSGIMLHTAALGFVIGVDIYDCVLVINSVQTLELFTRPRLTLGADCSLTVGPLANKDAASDPEMRWKGLDDTVLTYVKARGKHQPVPLDGSLVTERGNENERFYCANVGVLDILAGNIPKSIPEMRPLFEVIKAAEGRSDYDKDLMALLAQQPAPGDAVLEPTPKTSPTSAPKTPFGIPDADDPDPFGVIGLEMAGIEIREAGTRMRPTSTQFEYNPSPTSPVYSRFNRQSVDTYMSRSNRGSYMSSKTQATAVTDAYTQTDVASTADTTFSRANSDDGRDVVSEKLPTVMEPDEIDYTQIDMSVIERFSRQASPSEKEDIEAAPEPVSPLEEEPVEAANLAVNTDNWDKESSVYPADERDEDADDEDEEEEGLEDEPVILEVATAAQPARTSLRASQVTQVIHAKGAIVNIPKRIPPPLPARSPARTSRASNSEFGGDVAPLKSPLRSSFLSMESRPEEAHIGSEEVADVTSSDAFATPPAVMEPAPLDATPELEKTEAQGHRKNSSSVCTAVVAPVEAAEAVPEVPAIPQTIEPASSPEESEREPQTPKTEIGFAAAEQKKPEVDGVKDVAIASHNTESNAITVA